MVQYSWYLLDLRLHWMVISESVWELQEPWYLKDYCFVGLTFQLEWEVFYHTGYHHTITGDGVLFAGFMLNVKCLKTWIYYWQIALHCVKQNHHIFNCFPQILTPIIFRTDTQSKFLSQIPFSPSHEIL